MDSKERLRQYLEQRRDAGETELVLDSLSVEEVMRLLGASSAGQSGAASPTSAGAPHRPAADRPVRGAPAVDAAEGRDRQAATRSDWRDALRAADAGASGGLSASSVRPDDRAATRRPESPRSDAERAPAPDAPQQPSPPPGTDAAVPLVGDSPRVGGVADTGPLPLESRRAVSQPADLTPRDGSHATLPLESVPVGLVVGSPAHELFGGPPSPFDSLDALADAVRACKRCGLHATAKQGVPGEGNPHADLVCVGEAPGANEDEQGRPFVGQAGQLLTKILAAIQLSREEVFICNVLKHRPPGNRNPTPEEVTACSPFLVRQIELLQPKVIVALGTFAAQTLLQTREPIGKLRGKIHRYYGVPLIVTYHPAALLRNPSWKRPTWEDVQLARRLLDRARGT